MSIAFKASQLADRICTATKTYWVVGEGDDADFGLRMGPIIFWYYKWQEPLVTSFLKPHRPARKRELNR